MSFTCVVGEESSSVLENQLRCAGRDLRRRRRGRVRWWHGVPCRRCSVVERAFCDLRVGQSIINYSCRYICCDLSSFHSILIWWTFRPCVEKMSYTYEDDIFMNPKANIEYGNSDVFSGTYFHVGNSIWLQFFLYTSCQGSDHMMGYNFIMTRWPVVLAFRIVTQCGTHPRELHVV